MDSLTVKGIVTRASELGDNDNLVLLLTPDRGKLYVSGKGTRSLKNKNRSAVAEFSYGTFTLSSTRANRYYISEFEPIETFYKLRDDIEKLSLAVYMTDVAAALMPEGQGDPEIMSLVLNMLYAAANLTLPLWFIKGVFEFRAAVVSGYLPDLSACAVCGCEKAEGMQLDVMNGRILCADCRRRQAKPDEMDREYATHIYLPLSSRVLAVLRHLAECPPNALIKEKLDGSDLDSFAAIAEKYLCNHLEQSFPTLKFFKDITSYKYVEV